MNAWWRMACGLTIFWSPSPMPCCGRVAAREPDDSKLSERGHSFCKCLLNFRSTIAGRVAVASRVRTTRPFSRPRPGEWHSEWFAYKPELAKKSYEKYSLHSMERDAFQEISRNHGQHGREARGPVDVVDCFKYPNQIVSSSRPSSSDAFGLQHCRPIFPDCDYILLSRCVPYEDTQSLSCRGTVFHFQRRSMNEAVLISPAGLSTTRLGPPVMEIRKIAPHASSPLPLAKSVTPAA